MDITFLGTGAAMPTGNRFQSGVVVSTRDRAVLIDCGSGILHRLEQSNIGYEAIDTVVLTHHHLDHISDLLPLMKARWLAGEAGLTIAGPEGTDRLISGLLKTHEYMQDRLELTIRDIEPGRFTINGFGFEAVETSHSMECLAYRIDEMVTISGDTEPSEAVFDLADGSAVLIHDCAFPDDVDVSNHTRPRGLGRGLANIDVGRVYLTHLYPHCQGREDDMVASVQEHWDGTVAPAEDLLTISISE